jgi:hypothetical protein
MNDDAHVMVIFMHSLPSSRRVASRERIPNVSVHV